MPRRLVGNFGGINRTPLFDVGDDSGLASCPPFLCGPAVWTGSEFETRRSYIHQLSQVEKEELENALISFHVRRLHGDEVERNNFPLPTLRFVLEEQAKGLHNGQGFCVVRGLKPEQYSLEDNTVLFLGVAAYIGDQRGMQDKKGNMLSHITNSKLWTVPMEMRHGIHSNKSLPFHNDMGTDIVALQVRQCANRGGNTYVTSAASIYNDLRTREPSSLAELFSPTWPIQISGHNARHVLAPLMAYHDGRLRTSVDPKRLGPQSAVGAEDVPSLTAKQTRALEALDESARRSQLAIEAEPGDLIFINNWALLHRRDAYVDSDNTSRHLVRLWLRNTELGWSVPKSMSIPWLAAFGDNPKIEQRLYPIVPMPEYKVPKYSAGSAAFVLEDSDSESEQS